MADGRLAVLDFGVTENTPQGWPARLGPLLAAGRDSDAAELHRIAAEAGLLQPARLPPTPSSPLFDPYLDPLRTRPTGSLAAGAGADRRASDPLSAASRTQRRLTIPPRHLLMQRVATGLVASSARSARPSPSATRFAGGCPEATADPARKFDNREPGGAAQRASRRHRECADPPGGDRANIAATAPPSRSLLR